MDPGSLLASAAINIGLAFTVLSIFYILKKQPAIYYARRLFLGHRVSFEPFTFRRLLPSVAWIPRKMKYSLPLALMPSLPSDSSSSGSGLHFVLWNLPLAHKIEDDYAILLLLITLYFNEHCKSRFLPTFHC